MTPFQQGLLSPDLGEMITKKNQFSLDKLEGY